MNPVDFSPNSPGRMVPIAEGWSFLPNPLPPPLQVDASLVQAVESARAAVGELNGIARLTDIDLVTGILARREAVSSSRIEGTQTEIIEVFEHEALEGKALPEDSDLFEVLNYRSTLDLAIAWLDEGRSFGLPLVRDLHARLLQGVRGANREPGRFRQRNVYIGRPDSGFDGARFVPAPYEHIDAGMDALMEFMAGTPSFGPMVDTALAHYQFESIHPFLDGNGRLGRLLIPLHLRAQGALLRPLLYLGPYLQEHQAAYRDGLQAVSLQGGWDWWVRFILEAIRATAIDAVGRTARVLELKEVYSARLLEITTSRHAEAALRLVMRGIVVSAPQLQRAVGVSAPTARGLTGAMCTAGILVPLRYERGRSLLWARELFEAVAE